MLSGVLCLLGGKRKQLRKWDDLKKHMSTALVDSVRAATVQPLHILRWREAGLAVKSVALDELLNAASCPLPIRVLLKWFVAVRLLKAVVPPASAPSPPKDATKLPRVLSTGSLATASTLVQSFIPFGKGDVPTGYEEQLVVVDLS